MVETVRRASAMTAPQREEMSRAARTYYENNFTMARLVDRLETVLNDEIKKQER